MGYKFSLTHDKYTSLSHRRYIDVTLHKSEGKKTLKTWLIRIFVYRPSESLMQNIKDHADIVDQFCFNYAIHLGVYDTLHKKNNVTNVPIAEKTDSDPEEDEHGIYDDNFRFESVKDEINVNYPEILMNT